MMEEISNGRMLESDEENSEDSPENIEYGNVEKIFVFNVMEE
jgi:hypothetical protein